MKLLLTGAAGGVARQIRPLLLEKYGSVILSDHVEVTDLAPGESFRQADLAAPDQVAAMLQGVTHVIHLGGQSIEADWPTIMARNIEGLVTFYEAARIAGVKRVVIASSNHVIGFHARTTALTTQSPLRPDSRYGVSKAFAEAMAALYADKYGLHSLSIRIGNVAPEPADRRRLSTWQHPQDFVKLCDIGLTHPDIHAQIVWGVSNANPVWWDNEPAFKLGYKPLYHAKDYAARILAADEPVNAVGDQLQGADFASDEFAGDLERTLRS